MASGSSKGSVEETRGVSPSGRDETVVPDTVSPCDDTLMSAVGAGDMGAFEALILRYQKTAWQIAYRFLGDAAEVEDVAQSAFLKLLAAAPRYRPSSHFRTFFYRIVSRLCMDRARKMKPVYLDAVPDAPDLGVVRMSGVEVPIHVRSCFGRGGVGECGGAYHVAVTLFVTAGWSLASET